MLTDRVRAHAKPQSIAQQVVDSIRDMILSGEIEEGAPLRQDALAAALRVSRIPVREALRQLEAEGLVTLLAHRGAIVSALPLAQINELFDVRALLEQELLRRAIPRLTEADFTRAIEVLDVSEDAFVRTDARMWGQLNWRYHAALYAAASRPLTFGLVQTLHFNADRYLRLLFHIDNALDRSRREHRRLLELCRHRKLEPACDYLAQHIRGAQRALTDFLAARRTGEARLGMAERLIARAAQCDTYGFDRTAGARRPGPASAGEARCCCDLRVHRF